MRVRPLSESMPRLYAVGWGRVQREVASVRGRPRGGPGWVGAGQERNSSAPGWADTERRGAVDCTRRGRSTVRGRSVRGRGHGRCGRHPVGTPSSSFVGRARPSGRRRERSGATFGNPGRPVHKYSTTSLSTTPTSRFRDTEFRMLEIGVWKGGSLDMWRRYFGASATIVGIDVNPECAQVVDSPNVVRIGSQDDPDFLLRSGCRVRSLRPDPGRWVASWPAPAGQFRCPFRSSPMEGSTSSKTSTPAIGVISTTGLPPARDGHRVPQGRDGRPARVVSPS